MTDKMIDEFVMELSELSIMELLESMAYILLLGIGTGIIVGLLLYAICTIWYAVKAMID